MKANQQFVLSWFRGSFYIGLALATLALFALVYEVVQNGNWFVESLMGQLGIGLLFIYFSGKPMIDERIRYLKFKALAVAFIITTIVGNVFNYLYTYPDGFHTQAVSSYWFVLTCLLITFISFEILKVKE